MSSNSDDLSPALKRVKASREDLIAAENVADVARIEYESAVVQALEDHGYRTLAAVADVAVGAIQRVAEKNDVESPRSTKRKSA